MAEQLTHPEDTMTTATATAARYSVEKIAGAWSVVRTDDRGREVVTDCPNREAARTLAKGLREGTAAAPEPAEAAEQVIHCEDCSAPVDGCVCVETWDDPDPIAAPDRMADELAAEHATVDNDNAAQAAMDAERTGEAFRALSVEQQDEVRAEVIREDVLPTPPATRTKAEKAQRVTLARVKVGDRLMTNLTTEGNGIVYAAPHRFSDGQVRTVAEVTTRKAGDEEMPGTLYTLVFEDGTCSEERYGTTSHYPAEAFTDEPAPATPAPAEKPAPAKKAPKASAKKDPAPQIDTTPSRASKLQKGSRLVLRDLGVVTVDQVSKTGEGKLEVAYTDAKGEAGVREMWGSTNVRLAAE